MAATATRPTPAPLTIHIDEADAVWPRLWQTDRNICLRWHTCRINDGCPAGDVLSTTRTDQDGTQRQRVHRVQREYWNGLAQPGSQRSAGRAERWEPWRATETSSLRTA